MAKDGTHRGGARPGAGRKPKPLAEKLMEGKKATALVVPDTDDYGDDALGVKDILEFLSEDQKMGEMVGRAIFEQMVAWLKKRKCDNLVSPHLLEQYSFAMGRWVQLERLSNEKGLLMAHPTTGMPVGSPFVSMAQQYLKQANALYQQIFSVVSANCTQDVSDDDPLEELLNS